MVEETYEYQEARKEATHQGNVTGTLYREDEGSLSPSFFGISSLCWRKCNFYNDILNNSRYYTKL